jgi:hypothetical protein
MEISYYPDILKNFSAPFTQGRQSIKILIKIIKTTAQVIYAWEGLLNKSL